MLLIKGDPLAAPDDATRLVASLWRLANGRTIGLYILAVNGDEPCLGIHCRSEQLEALAADFVAAAINGTVEDGELAVDLIVTSDELAAIRLYPFARHLRLEQWRVWGQQRVDPLKFVYRSLRAVEPPVTAGVGVVIKPLPGHMNLARTTVFASGPNAMQIAAEVAASYEGIGVKPRTPFNARGSITACLEARVGLPLFWAKEKVDEIALQWHQKYETAA
ncbi:MAG: hypothetical protein ACYDGR_07290 [Candidatus Dormibacteria bacterium]